jgi:hypothetical protein
MTTPQDPFGPPAGSGSPWQTPSGGPTPSAGGQQPWGAQPPGQQPWGAQPSGPGGGQPPGAWGSSSGPRAPLRNGLGVAALICGILAVLTSWTVVGGIALGLAAIVLGAFGRGRARRGEADNGGTALAGIVLGVLGIVLSGAVIAAGVAIFQSDTGRTLIDCLEQAGDDVAAQEACQREVIEDLGG